MSTITIHAPVDDFAGKVAGVTFDDGVAIVERANVSAVSYFRRHGYGLGAPPVAEKPDVVDPRELGDGTVVTGTRLRDAAVDPAPGDFLPPTRAGDANPHGPEVVAPGLHAVPPGPVVPGPVSPDPAVQQGLETAVADAVLVEGADVGVVTRVAANANRPDRGPLDLGDVGGTAADDASPDDDLDLDDLDEDDDAGDQGGEDAPPAAKAPAKKRAAKKAAAKQGG